MSNPARIVAPGRTQSGFTLIELVVVMVILGILAAFAVPRFARMDSSARAATARSLEGSLRSASAMAHGMWLAAGTSPATVRMEGNNVTVAMNALGFPTAAAAGIGNTMEATTFTPNAATLAPGRFYMVPNGTTLEFRASGAPNNSNGCIVRYTPSATAGVPPTITTNVGAC